MSQSSLQVSTDLKRASYRPQPRTFCLAALQT